MSIGIALIRWYHRKLEYGVACPHAKDTGRERLAAETVEYGPVGGLPGSQLRLHERDGGGSGCGFQFRRSKVRERVLTALLESIGGRVLRVSVEAAFVRVDEFNDIALACPVDQGTDNRARREGCNL